MGATGRQWILDRNGPAPGLCNVRIAQPGSPITTVKVTIEQAISLPPTDPSGCLALPGDRCIRERRAYRHLHEGGCGLPEGRC